jgi:hypothetical protein
MMTSCVSVLSIAAVALTLCGLTHSRAETVSLQPIADTTLFQVAPGNNLGGASFLNAGTAGNGNRNRALLCFNLSGSIPAGSTVTSATLSMDVVRQPSAGLGISFFDLRRVFQPWGEGAQVPADPNSPGLGAPAAPGEATWNSRFAGGAPWSVPGGQAGVDFSTNTSATALVQGVGESVVFESTAQLAADIRAWLDQPAQNFGWMLMTEAEDVQKTARGFASRESGFGPTLTVEFTSVPEPSTIALVGISLFFFAAFSRGSR